MDHERLLFHQTNENIIGSVYQNDLPHSTASSVRPHFQRCFFSGISHRQLYHHCLHIINRFWWKCHSTNRIIRQIGCLFPWAVAVVAIIARTTCYASASDCQRPVISWTTVFSRSIGCFREARLRTSIVAQN